MSKLKIVEIPIQFWSSKNLQLEIDDFQKVYLVMRILEVGKLKFFPKRNISFGNKIYEIVECLFPLLVK